MKISLVTPLVLTMAGTCALWAANIATDYDRNVDFGRYHTYSWIKVQAEDELWNDRISSAVDNSLTAKGWQRVPSGGDAAVSAFGSTHQERTLDTWYNGFGGGWGWRRGWIGGPGLATTTVERTPVGTLMVDIFDSQTKKLIWRGSSSDTLSGKPEKNEKKLVKDVAEMFKKFPPAPRG